MRTRKASLVAVGLMGSLAFLGAGNQACSSDKSAIMLAVNTDMKAPKDVNAVSVTVSTNNSVKHNVIGRVTPEGDILLPATLAVVEPDEPNASIRIRVMAFQERKARVLRDVRTSIPAGGRIVLLRIPLNFVNDGSVQGSLPDNALPAPNPGTGGSSGSSGADGGAGDGGASNPPPTGGGGGVSGGDSFDPFVFVPNCPNPEHTWIDGECKDAYIDPETLPDFDPSLVGAGDDKGTCFDLPKCFAEAQAIGEGSGGGGGVVVPDAGSGDSRPEPGCTPDGAPCPEGQTCVDGKCLAQFSGGGQPGKQDLRPRAITLDKTSCTVALNGADASKLNLAIVTPDTGECVRPGQCYVPLDRGPGGWREEGGQIKLPPFVCKLLTGKELRLAASTSCAAKEEKNPICIDTAPPGDGGVTPPIGTNLVASAEFPTTVFATLNGGGSLQVGSAEGIGFIQGSTIKPIPGPPAEKLPWQIEGLVSLSIATSGTDRAYRLGATTTTIAFPPGSVTNGADEVGVTYLFAVGNGGIFTWDGIDPSATKLDLAPRAIPDATAITATPSGFVYGDSQGNIVGCSLQGSTCGALNKVGPGRVDAIVPKPFSANAAYALVSDGLYRLLLGNQQTGTIESSRIAALPVQGVVSAERYFRRGIVASPSCAIFSTAQGLAYVADDGKQGILVPGTTERPILGVTLGSRTQPPTEPVIFYTVFASRANGGGVYFVDLPPPCKVVGGGEVDGGFEAGADTGTCKPTNAPCLGPDECCSKVCAFNGETNVCMMP